MGFDLTNDSGTYLRFSPSGWALALELAESYGWTPAGTTLPPSGEMDASSWSGEYGTNDGQHVSADDAAALAEARARAIVSEDYARTAISTFQTIRGQVERTQRSTGSKIPPITTTFSEAEAAKFRVRLEELIVFYREGGFKIE